MADPQTPTQPDNDQQRATGPIAVPARLQRLIDTVIPRLNERFGHDALTFHPYRDELTVKVAKDLVHDLVAFLRDDDALRFNMMVDIHVVDWYRRTDRFEMIYNLWSLETRMRLRVTCFTQEKDPHVDTMTDLYKSADWYEREAYDMHGVIFDGHPDLRRMYMPEDFVDPETGEPLYPLRKEFPVMGIPGSMPLPEREIPMSTQAKKGTGPSLN